MVLGHASPILLNLLTPYLTPYGAVVRSGGRNPYVDAEFEYAADVHGTTGIGGTNLKSATASEPPWVSNPPPPSSKRNGVGSVCVARRHQPTCPVA